MSHRESAIVTHRVYTENGGVSPNAYVPEITVQIRVHFPPLVTDVELQMAFAEAVTQARRKINEKRKGDAE